MVEPKTGLEVESVDIVWKDGCTLIMKPGEGYDLESVARAIRRVGKDIVSVRENRLYKGTYFGDKD